MFFGRRQGEGKGGMPMTTHFRKFAVLCILSLVIGGCASLRGITTTPPRWVMVSVPNHGTLQQIQTRVSLDGVRWSGPSLVSIPGGTAVNRAVPPGVGAHYADGIFVLTYFDTGSVTNTSASRLHFMRSYDGLVWFDDQIYQENGADVYFNVDFRSQPAVLFDFDLDRWVVAFSSVSSQPLSGVIRVLVLQVPGYTTAQSNTDMISPVSLDGSVGILKHEGEFWIVYRDLFDDVYGYRSPDLQNWQSTSGHPQGLRSTDVRAGGGRGCGGDSLRPVRIQRSDRSVDGSHRKRRGADIPNGSGRQSLGSSFCCAQYPQPANEPIFHRCDGGDCRYRVGSSGGAPSRATRSCPAWRERRSGGTAATREFYTPIPIVASPSRTARTMLRSTIRLPTSGSTASHWNN
jgi:hypothetical protein